MISILTKFSDIIVFITFVLGHVVMFYFLLKGFNIFLDAILKQAKILKWVIQFFYYREEFFDYLKEKGL